MYENVHYAKTKHKLLLFCVLRELYAKSMDEQMWGSLEDKSYDPLFKYYKWNE